MAVAQSLKYGDLLNLQKADFDKAKGFFQYKGFNWQNAEKSKAYFEYNGFAVNADPVTWTKYGEKVIYETNDNCHNILLYYHDNQSFFDLENETKKYLKSAGTKSDNNIMK